ncbi:STN and carboxypeptidase regulatory-like domain-containing protein [Salmonirosea aquatica]|uniref:Secretin/TonB short N-terminal domain-containing protein n=1 Tax=Salmonirosea aquatica TaxID=2654236 RepID=A0A7C9BJC4_9BACT|nr:hypothetical protein [Cytophagaceae bacterium SJW1-29]
MKPNPIRFYSLLFLLSLSLSGLLRAQSASILETRITLRVVNERLDEVLRQISAKGGFSFSYSPDVIDINNRVSLDVTNRSVREILNSLFDGTVSFKERRRYVILQKAVVSVEKKTESFYLNGYIVDQVTGIKLPDASIYEPVTLVSTVSNQYGYYKIRLPTQPETLHLEVRKEAYAGRSVEVAARRNDFLTIALAPDTVRPLATPTPRIVARPDSSARVPPRIEIPVIVYSEPPSPDTLIPIHKKEKEKVPLKESLLTIRDGLVYALSTAKQAIHTENIEDTLYRPFQASLMPFIGTNQQLSGNVINDVSVNLLAGYSLGVNLLELGLGFNVVRWDVKGLQAAGLANLVGRQVNGVQVAGVANMVIGSVEGIQASGIVNLTAEDFRGLQMGGINVTGRDLYGWQLASGLNVARTVHRGHQVGFVNYADSSATTPFGYFSFVRLNGYRRLAFTTDELNYGNVTFKTGVRKFYNIFKLGTSGFVPHKPIGSIGYGVGTAWYLGNPAWNWLLNADYVASRVAVERRFLKQPRVSHMRLTISLEKKISPRLALSVGPTFNLLLSPYDGLVQENRGSLGTRLTSSRSDTGRNTYAWIGFQAGLRLCNRVN